MDSLPHPDSEQAIDISVVRESNANDLIKWIQQSKLFSLNRDDEKKFSEEDISGIVFLKGAGNEEYFHKAGFSFGARVKLADLAKKIHDGKSEFHFSVTNIASLPCYKSRLLVREVSRISHTRTNCSPL
jgi:hypothetical protein